MAKRQGNTHYSRAEAPLHSVRIRATDSGSKVRMVKIRMDGPTGLRWINYARWWWEQNCGAVPKGYRVAHADGDLLNDDPSNFILCKSSGDVAQIWHRANPEASKANHAACGRAAAVRNVQTAMARRRAGWLRGAWYPVDIERRAIHDLPRRKRWQIYARLGVFDLLADKLHGEVAAARGGDPTAARYVFRQICTFEQHWRWLRAASLGWPGRPLTAACILFVLAEASVPLTPSEVTDRVRALRTLCGWRPFDTQLGSLRSSVSTMRDLVVTHKGPWSLTPAAIAERLKAPRIVPIPGRDLVRFDEFDRVNHPYQSIKSEVKGAA